MRSLRAVFAMFVLMAVALLPGPSHALALAGQHRAAATPHDPAAHAAMAHDRAGPTQGGASTGCDGGRRPAGDPCHGCSLACCAPATAAVPAPLIVGSVRLRRIRLARPAADRPRPDAAPRPALRPPTTSA